MYIHWEITVFVQLIFVGFNEVLKNAANFERERIDIQAEILKGAAESFLKAGLPLEQINGLDEIGEGFFQAMLMENSAFFVS